VKVAVLMGGKNAERDVSLETGRAVAGALRELGHDVTEVDVDSNLPLALESVRPQAAFMALHGRGGEDGTVQGLLEIMRIPYTGCGVLASAVTIDKVVTKELLAFHGIPVIEDVVLERKYSHSDIKAVSEQPGYPVMVKPACEGSSIGITRVDSDEGLEPALKTVFERDDRALVERFVEGRLLTVGVLGNEPVALPVLEIMPREGFYDYNAKYNPGMTDYEVPAKLDPEVSSAARRISLESFKILSCEGVSRIDLMLEDVTGMLYVLEVNTIPGMTASSLLPKAALAIGMSFHEVVSVILASARLKIDLAW